MPGNSLDKSFQEVFNRMDDRINERSGWLIESMDVEDVTLFIYIPLSGSSYIGIT